MIHHGDCVEVMAGMEAESIDAIVTDPPYGLEFMGKEWDRLGDDAVSKSWDTRGRRSNTPERQPNDPGGRHGVHFKRQNPRCRNCGRAAQGRDTVKGFVVCHCEKPDIYLPAVFPQRMQAWHEAWAREAFRVAKPGAHLLAFGGTRTYHRLASAIEDAGWEIRDCLVWAYASGFPKSLDVSKAIDKARDDSAAKWVVADFLRPHVERVGFDAVSQHFGFQDETMARARWTSHSQTNTPTWDQWLTLKELLAFGGEMDAEVWRLNGRKGTPGENWDKREVIGSDRSGPASIAFARDMPTEFAVTAPATPDAAKWDGWGTALKPAWEPIVMARKPLRGTVAANVLAHGTGALNIDATRIGTAGGTTRGANGSSAGKARNTLHGGNFGIEQLDAGRWPPNLLLTDPIFDGDTPGVVGGGDANGQHPQQKLTVTDSSVFGGITKPGDEFGYGDSGTYSRFFLIPKSSRSDREPVLRGQLGERDSMNTRDALHLDGSLRPPQQRENAHPTVKPLDLMRHLVRLVTPPGGTVLDCFLGSGTTAIAAEMEGFAWIGIEKEAEYVAIAEARLNGVQKGMAL